MASKIIGVLPARLDSKRFPSKLLYPFKGHPLLYYVYQEIKRSKLIDNLIIATDSREIAETATTFGANVIMTSKKHKTGSDRVGEVLEKVSGNIFINIQADNFGLKASVLDRMIDKFRKDKTDFATMAYRINKDDELFDPNKVKVIVDNNSSALWFSRYPLPYLQNKLKGHFYEQFSFLGHIGVYFFTRRSLSQYCRWKRTKLEKAESLEQLRILENSKKIKVYLTKTRPISVDIKDDLKKMKRLYR